MKRLFAIAQGLLTLTLLAGCEREPKQDQPNGDTAAVRQTESARVARVILSPLSDSRAVGIVTFTATDKGVHIQGDVDGLTPGMHGFHIHEMGVCQADGSSAGAHYNPSKGKHSSPEDPKRHVGDLGNLVADELGHAHYDRVDPVLRLSGPDSIVGRSLLIHEKEDDLVSQPAGNSGSRISCGLIEKVE